MASRLQALVSKFRFQGDGSTADVARRHRNDDRNEDRY